MAVKLSLDLIRTDGGTQPRAAIDFETVNEYAEAMESGVAFPPVEVYYDGETYWCADGFHRLKAAWQNKQTEITANVTQGTREQAQWHSFGANKSHGLRRTNDDKQRAVKAALEHPQAQELSDRQIAKHVGVASVTVSEWRKKLARISGDYKNLQSPIRTGADGRSINTANIGRKPLTMPNPRAAPSAPTPEPAPSAAPVDLEFQQKQLFDIVTAAKAFRDCQLSSYDLAQLIEPAGVRLLEQVSEFIQSVLSEEKRRHAAA